MRPVKGLEDEAEADACALPDLLPEPCNRCIRTATAAAAEKRVSATDAAATVLMLMLTDVELDEPEDKEAPTDP